MFSMKGVVTNCFTIPESEKYEKSYKVQVLGDQITKDGQVRKEMVTMSVPAEYYRNIEGKLGEEISLPIGLFVSAGKLNVFFNKQAV